MAACRHLAGAVNWHFYSVLHHFIRALVLVGYQPNDKERIVIVVIYIANFVPFTLARLVACLPVVALMDAISDKNKHSIAECDYTYTNHVPNKQKRL